MEMTTANTGLSIIRIITGGLMAYHGWEVFDTMKMHGYAAWDQVKNLPAALTMVYVAKAAELLTGICFVLGVFTKPAAIVMAGIMLFICFFIGSGKFYYEDQHPFIFALLALVFFFTGSGAFAIDNKRLTNTIKTQTR
jgi:putative oxidoreductase